MEIEVPFYYIKKFLPSKRHTKLRRRQEFGTHLTEIREVSEKEFPVVFIVHDFVNVYNDAKDYYDFENKTGNYKSFAEPIRTFNSKLYKLFRITHGCAISLISAPKESVLYELKRDVGEDYIFNDDFPDTSIVVSDNSEEKIQKIEEIADKFVFFDGAFWQECNEPRYVINTFGLGHNHGGTGFFVEDHYNPNIPAKNYFNALHREDAIAYGKAIAERRGDTESVPQIGEHCNIEVLIPEMVHVDPDKQHGKGCQYLNECEDLIQSSSTIGEAGLLCIIKALKGNA